MANNPAPAYCNTISGFGLRLYVVMVAAVTTYLAWVVYKAMEPPSAAVLTAVEQKPISSAPRVRLSDGRFLAYNEAGVPKDKARYKVVLVHGFGRSRHDIPPASKDLVLELGIYFVAYDRAGYGQSDPNRHRTVKSEAFDIEQLADFLGLGPKFYLIATSIGGYSAWSSLKYIPHRLAGVAMLAPVTNYWWPSIPLGEAVKAFRTQPLQDQVAVSVAHYMPWLAYWWNTQPFFPRSTVIESRIDYLNTMDKEIIRRAYAIPSQREAKIEATRQGIYESLIRDMVNMFGSWEFDPCSLDSPFGNDSGTSVHIWHGEEDFLVPLMLQQHIDRKLPWVKLHIVPGAGHFLSGVPGLADLVLKTLLAPSPSMPIE